MYADLDILPVCPEETSFVSQEVMCLKTASGAVCLEYTEEKLGI